MRYALIAIVVLAVGCGGHAAVVSTSRTTAVAYAYCMRTHGVASWPDPTSSGTFDKSALTPQHLNIAESQIEAAQRSCRKLLPAGLGTPTSSQVQRYRHYQLLYAACMRTHGVPNMPDPDSRGHLNIGPGTGVDVNSPKFTTAFGACKSKLAP